MKDTTVCEGACVNLYSELKNIDPIGATYLWSPSGATTPNINVCPLSSQDYILKVTDGAGNIFYDTSIVIVNSSPMANAGIDVNICFGDSVLLQGSGGGTYHWLNSGLALQDYEVKPITTSSFILEVTQNSCSDTDTVVVNVFDLPVVSAVVTDVSCFGMADGSIQTNVVGGTPTYTYNWNHNITNTSDVTGLTAQDYIVTVMDSIGCIGLTQVSVNEPLELVSTLSTDKNIYCEGELVGLSSTTIGGVAPYSYSWNHSMDVIQNVLVTADTLSTNYEVYIEDQLGCKDTANISINVMAKPVADFGGGISGCQELKVNYVNNSLNADTYYWSLDDANVSSDESPILTYSNIGCKDVTLIAMNLAGCSDTLTKNCVSNVYPKPIALIKTDEIKVDEYEPEVTFINNSVDASICYTAFGDGKEFIGCSPKTMTHNYSNVGEFVVTHAVENSFGCVDTASIRIEVGAATSLFVPNSFMPLIKGENQLFKIYGYGISNFELKVFDRWGVLVFQTSDENEGWNGTYKGGESPQDVYIWKVRYEDSKSVIYNKIGHVNLLR